MYVMEAVVLVVSGPGAVDSMLVLEALACLNSYRPISQELVAVLLCCQPRNEDVVFQAHGSTRLEPLMLIPRRRLARPEVLPSSTFVWRTYCSWRLAFSRSP